MQYIINISRQEIVFQIQISENSVNSTGFFKNQKQELIVLRPGVTIKLTISKKIVKQQSI